MTTGRTIAATIHPIGPGCGETDDQERDADEQRDHDDERGGEPHLPRVRRTCGVASGGSGEECARCRSGSATGCSRAGARGVRRRPLARRLDGARRRRGWQRRVAGDDRACTSPEAARDAAAAEARAVREADRRGRVRSRGRRARARRGGEARRRRPRDTSWRTERYRSFFKDGVGLVLDAGRAVRVEQVVVETPTPGYRAEIRLGARARRPVRRRVARADSDGAHPLPRRATSGPLRRRLGRRAPARCCRRGLGGARPRSSIVRTGLIRSGLLRSRRGRHAPRHPHPHDERGRRARAPRARRRGLGLRADEAGRSCHRARLGTGPQSALRPAAAARRRRARARADRAPGDPPRQAGLHAHPGRPGRARRVARRRRRRGARVPPAPLRRLADAGARRSRVHVERFREATQARLDEYRAIEPTNTREGADRFHWFELRRAIERAEQDVAWADWVLAELPQC